MGYELKKNLPLEVQRECERIIAKPVAQRLTGELAYLAAHSDYFTGDPGNEVWNENSVLPTQLDPSTIQYKQITVSNAELLALFTTAKPLIAAPGAGKFIEIESASLSFIYSAAFTPGSATNLSIKYKDKTGADATTTRAVTGFMDQSSSQFSLLRALTTTQAVDANVVNQPVCLALVGGNPTGGAGSLVKVQIAYRCHCLV